MDRAMRINAIIRFVEANVKEDIDPRDLEKAVGLSYSQLRKDFRACAKMPLKKYSISRKIAYAAFEIETGDKKLIDIATEYGFDVYDTFTRSFKREVGVTPWEYREKNYHRVGHRMIGMGTYGPVMEGKQASILSPGYTDNLVLYGVPKIEYPTGKCTPLPASLESLLSYVGQRENCSYMWLMAATGMAFRLCWNPGQWDMGNSNIANISRGSPWEIYESAYRAAGWTCNVLKKETGTKQEFIHCIRTSLSKGQPVIALGVVGPPEVCVITGYDDDGERLLGWSYFQDNPEFTGNVGIDASGYFSSAEWWENPSTLAIMMLGEKVQAPSVAEIIERIHGVLTAESFGVYCAGQKAYECWARDLLDDRAFEKNNITPILLSRFFCQADTETMVAEGRYWGAEFFRWLSKKHADISSLCLRAANLLMEISEIVQHMTLVRYGTDPTEESLLLLCNRDVRREIVSLIQQAQEREQNVTEIICTIMSVMQS